MSDEEVYARLEAPKTIVVKYGHLKLVAEFPYDGSAKPGCGSKLIARTTRGTEVVDAGKDGWQSGTELSDFADHPAGDEDRDWRALDPRRGDDAEDDE